MNIHEAIAPVWAFNNLTIAHQAISAAGAFGEIVHGVQKRDPMRKLAQCLVKRFAPREGGDMTPFLRFAAHHVHVHGAIHHLERLAWTLAFNDPVPANFEARMLLVERDRREHVFKHLSLFIGQDRG